MSNTPMRSPLPDDDDDDDNSNNNNVNINMRLVAKCLRNDDYLIFMYHLITYATTKDRDARKVFVSVRKRTRKLPSAAVPAPLAADDRIFSAICFLVMISFLLLLTLKERYDRQKIAPNKSTTQTTATNRTSTKHKANIKVS